MQHSNVYTSLDSGVYGCRQTFEGYKLIFVCALVCKYIHMYVYGSTVDYTIHHMVNVQDTFSMIKRGNKGYRSMHSRTSTSYSVKCNIDANVDI